MLRALVALALVWALLTLSDELPRIVNGIRKSYYRRTLRR